MPEPCGAQCADVIAWSALASVCPLEAAALDDLLRKHGFDTDVLAMALDGESDIAKGKLGKANKAIRAAWAKLQAAFEANTTVDGSSLRLHCRYHEPNTGGQYDQVVYGIFYLEGCTEFSPAGKKFQSLFRRQSWVRNQ